MLGRVLVQGEDDRGPGGFFIVDEAVRREVDDPVVRKRIGFEAVLGGFLPQERVGPGGLEEGCDPPRFEPAIFQPEEIERGIVLGYQYVLESAKRRGRSMLSRDSNKGG